MLAQDFMSPGHRISGEMHVHPTCTKSLVYLGTLESAFGVPKGNMFMMDDYGPAVEKMYTQKVNAQHHPPLKTVWA